MEYISVLFLFLSNRIFRQSRDRDEMAIFNVG